MDRIAVDGKRAGVLTTFSLAALLVSQSHALVSLQVGVWTDITPAGSNTSTTGFLPIAIDPNNPSIVYVGQCGNGMWKTTDGGSSWNKLGDASQMGTNYATTSKYIDNPVCIAIDPQNSQHLFTCHTGWCGSGQTVGFWESTDGGKNWTMPVGFVNATKSAGSSDVGRFDIDPSDFKHILISMHYTPDAQFGFLESTDGGATFTIHAYPFTVPAGTKGINFLHCPAQSIGDGNAWLISSEQAGFWRTSDAGATWTNVAPTYTGVHGGVNEIYYAKTGTLYMGGYPNPYRSSDNGKTWQPITDKMYGYYTVFCGDGDNLYTGVGSYMETSPETDGLSWTSVQSTATPFSLMRYDSVNHIMYGSDLSTGGKLWALKTRATTSADSRIAGGRDSHGAIAGAAAQIIGHRLMIRGPSLTGSVAGVVYDVKGQLIGRVAH